jgi:predicted lipoprotein with Yx(FWY)xxD motif
MNQMLSLRRFALGIALGTIAGAALLVAAAHGDSPTTAGGPKGALVALRKTTLGSVLVDARGRTLYLFEKDRNGKSACDMACASYWPPLVSGVQPRAGTGVHKPLLGVTKRHDGRRQVTYAGHPLYRFAGDKNAGQTKGEGLTNFGAEWYVVAATGRTIEPSNPSGGGYGSGGGGYGSGGGGW